VIVGYAHPETMAEIPSHQESSAKFSSGASSVLPAQSASLEPDLYPLQWDKKSQSIRQVHAVTRGAGVVVATVGTGAIDHHPDLAPSFNIERSRNVTEDKGDHNPIGGRTHGTHIAGCIAANHQRGGITGIAPEVDLIDVRAISTDGMQVGDMIAGLVYAINEGSDIINLSQNWYPYTPNTDSDFLLETLQRVLAHAEDESAVIVCSVGNNSAELVADRPPFSLPVNFDQVVAVSATAPKGYAWPRGSSSDRVGEYPVSSDMSPDEPPETPTAYTNYGEEVVTVSAPGGQISGNAENYAEARYDGVLSTSFAFSVETSDQKREPSYAWEAGTSFAAPQVTGALALLKSEHPELQPDEVRTHLRRTAENISPNKYRGSGHLNISALIETPPL